MVTRGESTLGKHTAPLAVRMRPRNLDEIVGQQKLLEPASPLRSFSQNSYPTASVILWGPPGTGKTSIAYAIAQSSDKKCVELSAVTAGVKDVRLVMDNAKSDFDLYGTQTVLFLDEIHRFSKAQQDALLPGVENGVVTLIAATTENPSFSVITPLLSRSLLLTLEPLTPGDIELLIHNALSAPYGLDSSVDVSPEALTALIHVSSGDARRALTSLEAASHIALERAAHTKVKGKPTVIGPEDIAQAASVALLRYDRQGDEHYDVISAFIKSIRGSDPDAAIHYLARMISAGEDPRFIARRLIISASEDIGLADPQALGVATSAADAVALIGMPEGRIPLAEATIYLATAPKSNKSYLAINKALSDVERGQIGVVPPHLRDAHYPGAKSLGHGAGYNYPHDSDLGVVSQQYLPDQIENVSYYEPTEHGYERELRSRLEKIRSITRGYDRGSQ
jgi:putative ATPase